MLVKAVPDGYTTITSYIIASDAQAVVDFLVQTFDCERLGTTYGPEKPSGGRYIMNAEMRVGTARIMIADAQQGRAEANPVMLYCYVDDVDAVIERAVAAGGEVIMPPTDMFYGDRHGAVSDPCGNQWFIASRFEDLSEADIQKRADDFNN